MTFVQTFLGALLALVVFAAMKWTLVNPVMMWWLRRSIGKVPGLAELPDFDPATMQANFEQRCDEERKQLAAEIARALREDNP